MSLAPDLSVVPQTAVANAPGAGASRRHLGIITAGFVVSGVGLYVAMRGTDLRQVGSVLAAADLRLAVPLIIAQCVFYTLKAIRWRMLLAPVAQARASRLAAPMMIGFMGNNLLPARLGELIRLHLGARVLRVPHSQVLATLVLERLFDFLAVLALFAGAVAIQPKVPVALVSAAYVSAAVGAAAVAATAAFIVWTAPVLRLASVATNLLPDRLASSVNRQLELMAQGMGSLRRPRLLAGIIAASIAQWFLMALCIYLSFWAVDLRAPLSAAFVVLAATVFGVMVPAAPGFFGTLHVAFVLALAPFDVGDGRAMAAAVFYHAIPYVGVTLAGAWYIRRMGVRLLDVEKDALNAGNA